MSELMVKFRVFSAIPDIQWLLRKRFERNYFIFVNGWPDRRRARKRGVLFETAFVSLGKDVVDLFRLPI
jgi:hypothetical protein